MSRATSAAEPLYSSLSSDPDLREIVDLFVEEMPGRVATMLQQLDAQDWDRLRRTAHQLKGAAGSYGFHALTPAAGKLEDAIRGQQSQKQIRRFADDLIDLCRRVRGGTPT
jgi:HPt (histidine-containing phosphotransfer) domain-containing protein